MPVLRWLKIFVPLLLVAVLVAGAVVVFSSRSELQKSRGRVDDAWAELHRDLRVRYDALHTANDAVKDVTGPLGKIRREVADDYVRWRDLDERDGSVASEVEAANALESSGRRLVFAALAAPRLKGNQEKLGKIDAYATLPLPDSAANFEAAVTKFEELRARPSYSLAARILGYDSIPDYDTSGDR
jgi:hypothetical protein